MNIAFYFNRAWGAVTSRAISNGDVLEMGKTDLVQSTYLSESSNNKVPQVIKDCNSIWDAKKPSKNVFQIYRFNQQKAK